MWSDNPDLDLMFRTTPAGEITFFALPPVRETSSGAGALAAGSDGNVWFARPDLNRIGRITPSGVVREFPVSFKERRDYEPALTAGPDGNVWFSDPGRARIGRISPDGVVVTFPAHTPGGAQPAAITTGPDGNIWFTVPFANRVGRMTPQGSVKLFPAPFMGGEEEFGQWAGGIAAGPDGNVWFTEPARGRIARISRAGVVSQIPPTPVIGTVRLRGTGAVGVQLRCSARAALDCRGVVWLDDPDFVFVEGPGGLRNNKSYLGARRFELTPSGQAEFVVPLTARARRRLLAAGRLHLDVVAAPWLLPTDMSARQNGAVVREVVVRVPVTRVPAVTG
jgi:hypothetical protein